MTTKTTKATKKTKATAKPVKAAKRASKKAAPVVIELTRQQVAAIKAWKTIRANRAA